MVATRPRRIGIKHNVYDSEDYDSMVESIVDRQLLGGMERMMTAPTAKLKNGTEETVAIVSVTMQKLQRLQDARGSYRDAGGGLACLYELVHLCKDSTHSLYNSVCNKLDALNLVVKREDGSYYVHESIRNVILSAVKIDGFDVDIIDPVDRSSQPYEYDEQNCLRQMQSELASILNDNKYLQKLVKNLKVLGKNLQGDKKTLDIGTILDFLEENGIVNVELNVDNNPKFARTTDRLGETTIVNRTAHM